MMSLSNKVLFDISSRLSGMVLKNSSGAMAPYISNSSFSTTNHLELSHPSMPKKPLSSYFRYMQEIRPMVERQNPNLKMVEVSKVIAQKYKELPVTRKEALNEAYLVDKKNYLQQFEKFKNTPEGKEILEKMKQEGKEKKLQKSKTALSKLKTDLGKPVRYPMAYNLFVVDYYKKGGAKGVVTNAAKEVAEKWKNLGEMQKAPYVKKSNELKAQYEKDLAAWEAKQGTEGMAKIEQMEKKVVSARNDVKGVVPKPKAKPKKKVVAKKVAKPKKVVKKAATKKPAAKKEPVKAKKEPAKAKKEPAKAKKKM